MIFYKDVFGTSHQTKFCAYLSPNLKDFQVCDTYNDAT
jgi:hypothetical protein